MIEMKNINFRYKNETDKAGLYDINLYIAKGEVVLLCGESGCGKTTLTRLINGLIPHYFEGELLGEVLINGKDIKQRQLYETAENVGSVFQNPRSQFFNVDTNSELAFSCENQGLPIHEIMDRMEKTIEHLKISDLMNRNIFNLSGGEKQKIACGCVHTASPEIIVLDEPSSNLDSQATMALAEIIAHWKSEGKTVVIAEHRLYYLRDIADRMMLMHEGKIEREFDRNEMAALPQTELSEFGLRQFSLSELINSGVSAKKSAEKTPPGQIELIDFHFHYKNGLHALNIDSLFLPQGQIIVVIGKNGAGKSTFSRCLCGLPKKFKGTAKINGKVYRKKDLLANTYMVMQDVNHQLFTESVLDEITLSMKEENTAKAESILDSLNLLSLEDRHPMSLSGGQKQRVAIGSAVASEREIIIFDEPSSGLDLRHMEQVSQNIKALKAMGKTQVIVSHDLELILKTCDYVIHLEDGKLKKQYPLAENEEELIAFFSGG